MVDERRKRARDEDSDEEDPLSKYDPDRDAEDVEPKRPRSTRRCAQNRKFVDEEPTDSEEEDQLPEEDEVADAGEEEEDDGDEYDSDDFQEEDEEAGEEDQEE
ncbi:hypothetical protein BaOVIS_003610 [Babesia ovis]|uniref:Uncharacterized protein n=1 Tax=Babesia ovis TaxID=5869 RepID=A0A9W5T894_BABOV|nr:hypothetical protein BaOVIS_003610 [Babesia ovis]